MKRRHFCGAALSAACSTVVLSRAASSALPSRSCLSTKTRYKWAILYWMPYDNDLVRFGEDIVDMLVRGSQHSEALVAVQSDYFGDTRMRRRQILGGTVHEVLLDEEDSSDIDAFARYLDWAYTMFEADHWAIIIVGHGGQVNQVSPDDHGTNEQLRSWMGVDQLAQVIDSFNEMTGGRVELLFFQNCNKATLEVIYEVRNCARYTLASQLLLGAPNYYYENFLQQLNDTDNGYDAALTIGAFERPDMFHSLTLIDNQELGYSLESLTNLIQALDSESLRPIALSILPKNVYFDEQYCDLLTFFGHLSRFSENVDEAFTHFADLIEEKVIAAHITGGELYSVFSDVPAIQNLCGLSLYIPDDRQGMARYASKRKGLRTGTSASSKSLTFLVTTQRL
jgi:hypothetical protein